MHTSYEAVEAVRRARYHRPENQRPVRRRKNRERYRRPPRARARRSR